MVWDARSSGEIHKGDPSTLQKNTIVPLRQGVKSIAICGFTDKDVDTKIVVFAKCASLDKA